MTAFRHVSRINVSLWGERVGTIVETPQRGVSFLLKKNGSWSLAPAYDLTGSSFPSDDPWSEHGGTHQLSVNGKTRDITREDLLTLADRFGIGTARALLS